MTAVMLPSGKQSILKKDLRDKVYYRGFSQSTIIAMWDAQREVFWYNHNRFTFYIPMWLNHPEDKGPGDLFFAIAECEPTSKQRINLPVALEDNCISLAREAKRRTSITR